MTIRTYWPCMLAVYIGYIFAIFTCGLSFLLPQLCISDAKKNLLENIMRMNRTKLEQKGLKMEYRSSCMTSWIELKVIAVPEKGESLKS